MFNLTGRQYVRSFGNHETRVFVSRGSALDIQMTVPVDAALQIFREGYTPISLSAVPKSKFYVSEIPGLDGIVFFPGNTPWLSEMLEGVRAAKAIRGMLKEGAEWAVSRQVLLQPGLVSFHLYEDRGGATGTLDQDTLNRWISSLEAFADELQETKLPRYELNISSGMAKHQNLMEQRGIFVMAAGFIGVSLCMFLVFLIIFLGA